MSATQWVQSFDGTRLYTEALGDGPWVVLCDGLGCDGFIWKYLRKQLAGRYRLLSWHYRGHGKSEPPAHPDAVGVSALCGDLRAVMDAHGVDSAILMGHSMGAQVVFAFALADAARVRGVVSLCGSYGRPLDTLHDNRWLGQMFYVWQKTLQRFPNAGERIWQWFFSANLPFAYARRFEANPQQLVDADFRPYFEHLRKMDPHVFASLVARLQQHSVLGDLKHLLPPALLVAGEQDTFCPMHLSERMHRRIPRAQLLVVPKGSHVAPLENPSLVYAGVSAFLHAHAGVRLA